RPILAAPVRGTEFRRFAGSRLTRRVDIRTAGLRIYAAKHVLFDERFAVDEIDRAVGAFEEPQIAVARDVNESLDRATVPLVVDGDRRRPLIPIPRVVRVVLVIALDSPGRRVNGNRRRGVEIVARSLIAHPGTAVAGAPEHQVRVGIVVAGDPD